MQRQLTCSYSPSGLKVILFCEPGFGVGYHTMAYPGVPSRITLRLMD